MDIDQAEFNHIFRALVEDNPLACRAVLSICRVNFTTSTRSLSVTLGEQSELCVNLDFLKTNCHTHDHVRAVLLHEFLHVLLGHTLKWEAVSRAQNVALDAVINAVIHREMGCKYSSMMAQYYKDQKGLLRLLRPMTDDELSRATRNARPGVGCGWAKCGDWAVDLDSIHAGIYRGEVLADDVLEVAEQMAKSGELISDGGYRMLLGGHGRAFGGRLVNLPESIALRLKYAQGTLPPGILPSASKIQLGEVSVSPQMKLSRKWIQTATPFVQELLTTQRRGRFESVSSEMFFHHPTPEDRRRCLLAQSFPLLLEFRSTRQKAIPQGTVNVYLDISASMDSLLSNVVDLLVYFRKDIAWPLWAFSTTVAEASFSGGRLCSTGTGGTNIQCVLEHLRSTKSRKALVVTDGFVESRAGQADPPSGDIRALVTPNGSSRALESWGIRCLKLPDG
jgi:hypothetical protein